MSAWINPAWQAFLKWIGNELVWAEVVIRPRAHGYEVRHLADRSQPETGLCLIPVEGIRALAQFTADGAFRPLKTAPTLQAGWRVETRDSASLEFAVNQLYPGSVADWFATLTSRPPVTNYREFMERQTGMYRITTKLTDAQVSRVIRVCCHESQCLKQRLWTVNGSERDEAENKSAIPCLEPCAILLECARKTARSEQQGE